MHRKMIKVAEKIMCEIEKQLDYLECVNTKELGEAVDMIKDLSEAMYYDVVTETMLKVDELSPKSVEESHHDAHSYHSRKVYLEAKEKHLDKAIQMRELEKYMQELTHEIIEMIDDATPEEKTYLTKRITTLATKINSVE
jgi:hypothetical protein